MDKMDRLLGALGDEEVPAGLAASVIQTVRRRQRRRLFAQRAAASVLAVLGLWLLWPGLAWLASAELYASSASWLAGGLDYLNYESIETLSRLWSGASSAQGAIGSAVDVSTWLGAVVLCCAIFLALDTAVWRSLFTWTERGGNRTMLASSVHP